MNDPTGGAADFLLAKAMEERDEARAEVARLRADLDAAHMMVASLVTKAGGEVTLTIADLAWRGTVDREDDGFNLNVTLRTRIAS